MRWMQDGENWLRGVDFPVPSEKPVMTRIYRLCSSPERYVTGHLADGRQVLMGVICPNYSIHFFAGNGSFLGVETRKLTLPPSIRNGIYHFDVKATESLAADVSLWCEELGFKESCIDLLKFESEEACIEDLPAELIELEEHPENFAVEDLYELLLWKAEWIDSQMFALEWGEEYLIDPDGTINSS